MHVPLEITFRNMDPNEDIKELIRQKADKVDRVSEQLISCRVAVEKKQQHQQTGNSFRVRVNLRLPPGHEIVVDSGEAGKYALHDDLSVVIRDVFEAALRQVKKRHDVQREQVKTQPQQEASGSVVQLFPENGYGFIRSMAGQELFFHRNSVLSGDFDRLEIGAGVRYVETSGEKGPQAGAVQIVDNLGVRAARTEGENVEQSLA